MFIHQDVLLQPMFFTGFLAFISSCLTIYFWRKSRTIHLDHDDAHVFTFQNRELTAASQNARDALNVEDLDEDIYNQMIYRLGDVFADLPDNVQMFEENAIGFELKEASTSGPVSFAMQKDGQNTIVRIRGMAAPLSRKMVLDRDLALATESELKTLRGTVETAPFPMWRENGSGAIDWVNRAYLTLLDETEHGGDARTWPPMRLFESGTVVRLGEPPVPSRKVVKRRDNSSDWFDITAFGIGENSLHFAVNANATAKAEESQRNFLQTLTQTFAYLQTGLAIFDRSRQLVLFNPSLTDLTGLEPQWLILKPTLYDFLNKLRENRILPERKDFTDWRGKINALEQSAREGSYSETWMLPTGQTYRMTGRPHPEGAIAFLFEDISAEIALTRKFRQRLDLSQSTFDNLSEAIAVFGADGALIMSNDAYDTLWKIPPEDVNNATTVIEASKMWQINTQPTPIWGDAREFIHSAGERSEWSENIRLLDGRQLRSRFTPLAGGATMAAFEDIVQSFAMPELRNTSAPSIDLQTIPPKEVRVKSA
jgi:PAS domain-containing protein